MKKLINFFTRLCEAYLPDAFVFCLILTLFVFLVSLGVTDHNFFTLVEFWGRDFWSLNSFSMQMVFVLISGHMLASTPLIRSLLRKLTQLIKTESQALVVLSIFSLLASWINWGFGLIISGILALELAHKLRKVNFGLFVATAYSGFVVWHGGLSGSIPLKIAGQDEILNKIFSGVSIPLNETIFSTSNLLIVFFILLIFPVLALLMKTEEKVEIGQGLSPETTFSESYKTLRDKLENTKFFNFILFVFFLIILFQSFFNNSPFDINKVNFIFLFLSIILHQTPKRFLNALQDAIGNTSGIIIQFPFYAGLMGLMQYSGLAEKISLLFVNISSAQTLPLWTFLSSGLVNFFIPSGGGQWVIQGPIMLKAASSLNVDPAKISMAIAWGDAWTNLIQPFWALPLLALAKISLKDIMGYCLIYLTVSGFIISMVLYFN